jgi:hypothetical protein
MCTRFIVLIIGFVRCCLLQWLCRLSKAGAHYNPSMSFSNFFIKFSPNKFNPFFMWTYFKAEFVPAFLAYNMAFYLNGYYSPIDLPKTR